jgi:uncharacterized protein (DUF427 family)
MSTLPEWAAEGRSKWRYRGQERPSFASIPEDGQESVWDYPRPPRLVHDGRKVVVRAGVLEIARTLNAIRVLETASPPTFYIPPGAVRAEFLHASTGISFCEWKGAAQYWTVAVPGQSLERVAWSYPDPFPGFEQIRGYLSFYPAHLECTVGGVRVLPQPGSFYGGWVTPEVCGPFKGEPGSEQW